MTVPIVAAKNWANNAAMMVDVAALWIDLEHDCVLDPTYGQGGFWKKVKPKNLTGTDLYTAAPAGADDFTQMQWLAEAFDVVVFDPAYVTPGGRATSTIVDMNQAYGMDTAARTLVEQWEVICDGMLECWRVLKPGGLIMQKCMNYISSGSFHNYRHAVTNELARIGFEQVDEFSLVRKAGGPQPKNRTRKCAACRGAVDGKGCDVCGGTGKIPSVQHHARNNVSFLIVARKPGRRRKR